MEIIMVILAAIVAALLIGPAVAIGAIVDSRKVRSLAVLLRGRLEAVSEELGGALVRAGRAERAAEAAARRIEELKKKLELFEDEAAALWLERAEAQRATSALRKEAELLRNQQRFLVDQRDALLLSVRGLTADAEGASSDAVAMRALYSALMSERGETLKRLSAANSRVKALEAFINRAYGPVDECEIGTRRICAWCETLDLAGGNACEVCDQPF